jgi:hypothetical protein
MTMALLILVLIIAAACLAAVSIISAHFRDWTAWAVLLLAIVLFIGARGNL